jgi:hypothetical protein
MFRFFATAMVTIDVTTTASSAQVAHCGQSIAGSVRFMG